MPPYKPVVSKAQSRKLFALAERGEGISMDDAKGKTREANFADLPQRKVKRGRRGPKRSAIAR